jgi:hypothetical protein
LQAINNQTRKGNSNIHKVHLHGKETKFITELFKQIKAAFQTNNAVEKLSRNNNLTWKGI